MNAWVGLVKKEFRLTRTLVLSGIIFLALYFLALYFMPFNRLEDPWAQAGIMIGLTIIPFVFHVFYLTGYMLYSLMVESKKLHLWLHNPQPAVNLLGAKLVNGVFALIVSITLSAFILYLNINKISPYLPLDLSMIQWGIFVIALGIIVGSLLHSMWIVAAWTLYQACKTYIGRWSFFIAIGFLVVFTALSGFFEHTQLFALLTDWGHISIGELLRLNQLELPPGVDINVMASFPFGQIVYHTVISIILFAFSCWLLDRKVEV